MQREAELAPREAVPKKIQLVQSCIPPAIRHLDLLCLATSNEGRNSLSMMVHLLCLCTYHLLTHGRTVSPAPAATEQCSFGPSAKSFRIARLIQFLYEI